MSGVQVLVYVPVIHRGYERLFAKWARHGEVLVLGQSFGELYPALGKEIRALDPARVVDYLEAGPNPTAARVVEVDQFPDAITADLLVVPDEELIRDIVDRYKLSAHARVQYENTFLRWDRGASIARHEPRFEARINVEDLERKLGGKARALGGQSSDWWRQVGALAAKDGKVLASAFNRHYPSEYSPYVEGDPRNNFSRGLNIDLSTALHAEAAVIAQAAKDGTSLEGSDLYVSTFPCPGCARLLAAAGIARCFYSSGYSMLDGERVLQDAEVQMVFVELDPSNVEQLSIADLMGSSLDR
jgi:dCMP deaminase